MRQGHDSVDRLVSPWPRQVDKADLNSLAHLANIQVLTEHIPQEQYSPLLPQIHRRQRAHPTIRTTGLRKPGSSRFENPHWSYL